MLTKDDCRSRLPASPGVNEAAAPGSGRMAEQVRRLEGYRSAKRIFATPAHILRQVRINALVDGKELLMPAPGLKEGFLCIAPFKVPFSRLAYAVTPKGLADHGRRLGMDELAKTPVGLLFTDFMAVDHMGGFVGDGKGFFDLAVGVLARLGALPADAEAIGFGMDTQVLAEEISLDPWDVRLNRVVTEAGMMQCSGVRPAVATIHWEHLTADRVRKISPLWKLSGQVREKAGPHK